MHRPPGLPSNSSTLLDRVGDHPAAHGDGSPYPARGFRVLVLAAALATWALVAVGGVVRVTESGLGCPHWPLCTSRAIPLDRTASFIEYSHRAVVALVVVLVAAVAAQAWRRYRVRRDIWWPALAAAVLVPFQAVLGAIAVWLKLPGWVVAFHFVVGLLFLATITYAASSAWRRRALTSTPGFRRLVWGTVLVGAALVSVGASVVATDAGTACGTQWPLCNGTFVAGGGHADVQVAHRLLAYVVAILALGLLVLAWRGQGPHLLGSLPIAAVLIQMTFGILIVVMGGEGVLHKTLEGLHEAGSGTVWATFVALAAASGGPWAARAEPSAAQE